MRKKIGRMLSVLLASATFLSGSYIPVSASSPFATTATSGTDKSSSKETTASTTDDSSGTVKTNLNAMTLSTDTEEVVSSSDSDDNTGSVVVDSATISTFDDRFDKKTYPIAKAPLKEELIDSFPGTVSAITTSGESVTIPVKAWHSDDYDNEKVGDYTFLPEFDEKYNCKHADVLPFVNICVKKNEITEIKTSFENEITSLQDAPEKEALISELPARLSAICNEEEQEITIESWETDYDNTKKGIYQFTPIIDETKYELLTNLPYFTVTVEEDNISVVADSGSEPEGKVTKIETFVAQVASGATKMTNGDYVWAPKNSAAGHVFSFRVNYSFSGQGTINGDERGETSAIKITIPKTILKDRSGDRSDTYEMSIPERDEIPTLSQQEIKELIGLAYYEDGENIVIYNFEPLDAAQNGYFEVGYITKKTTFNYKDYDSENDASMRFSANIEVSGLSAKTNELCVYINTKATVNSTYEYYPVQSFQWKDSWGDKPSDADDYVWQRWEIGTDVADDPTQLYELIFTNEVECNEVPVEIYGYKISGNGSSITKTNKGTNLKYDGYRFDYVFTRIKKSDLRNESGYIVDHYTIRNKTTVTLHPIDGVDEDTIVSASRNFSWTLPVFVHPTGHYYMWKFGNENWTNNDQTWGLFGRADVEPWDYASYDLDRFQEKKISSIDNIKYAIWYYGWPFPWTVRDGGSSDNWKDYGYKSVTYQLTDEALYDLNADGTYGDENKTFNPDYTNGWETSTSNEDDTGLTPRMNPEDYDFSKISLHVYFMDVPRDENGNVSESAGSIDDDLNFVTQFKNPTENDIIEIYTKSGSNDYVKAGEYNLATKKVTATADSLIDTSKMTSDVIDWVKFDTIYFKDGVDGFKLRLTNNYWETDIKAYAYISIKNTERMLDWTGTGKITDANSTAKDAVIVRNVANLQTFDSDNNLILDLTKTTGDRLKRAERTSEISKIVVGAGNNKKKRECTVSWKVTANETLTSGNGTSEYISQNSGTFYDLLPAGSTLQQGSVAVAIPYGETTAHTKNEDKYKYLSENAYTVKTIDNFRNSGRTMLIVSIKDAASYYSVFYTTVHSWDSIADYGINITNPVAYETGNDEISGGFPDDPSAENNDGFTIDEATERSDVQLSEENRILFKDLDSGSDAYRFIYDETQHDITAITSASAGLNKRVRANSASTWDYETTIHPDEKYTYRLRFANTYMTSAKDIILYDSLENYYKTDGAEKGESDWYGALQFIDTSQMSKVKSSYLNGEEKDTTLNPVVYVSTVSGLDLDEENNKNLANTSIWTELTETTDLSKVKAIAYDLRKDSVGDDFILKPGGSVSSAIYMTSPHMVAETNKKQYPETYNNVYMKDTVIGTDGSETPYSIHYDYTTVRYMVTANFGIHKVSAKDTSESIKDVSFHLFGTSDYGTSVDQITATDKNGIIDFQNIEKGTYILQEYSTPIDWLEDHKEYEVVINAEGKVTIDGVDYTDKNITIKNNPRIHGDVFFLKRSYERNNWPVDGATFKLSGTSYYGNDVLMYSTSKTSENNDNGGSIVRVSGGVTFENVERGTYELKEVEAPGGYIKCDDTYTVTIDENGNCNIEELTKNQQGNYEIYNEPYHSFMILKRSSYDNSPIEGVEFHLTGTSDYGTKVDMTVTSKSVLGSATFGHLESGTYVLEESKGVDGFIKNEAKWTVNITKNGIVTIPDLQTSTSAPNTFICVNTKIPDGEVVVLKKWVDDDQNNDHSDELPTIHLVSTGAEGLEGTVD